MSRTAEIVCELVDDAADSLAVQLEAALSSPEAPWPEALREGVRLELWSALRKTTGAVLMELRKEW